MRDDARTVLVADHHAGGESDDLVRAVRTICPYCGVGCGVLAGNRADGTALIRGDHDHPANFGRLCAKGSALGETVNLKGRLLYPEIGGERSSWDSALDLVARRFSDAIAAHGPDSVAFYVSGQLLTEDYYVANKLMKGFIGSANIDTNSRLCMASSVAGHRRAFGSDTVPGLYEDIELADLVIITGSNLAWCHPVLYQRLHAAKATRPDMRVVLIDPRATMTNTIADLHLAIASDGDAALFCGLLSHLVKSGRIDGSYIGQYTQGFEEALAAAQNLSDKEIAAQTGLSSAEIEAFYDLFASTEKTVTIYSQGVNQSSAGTDKVNAIINCHLAAGRIGKPGCGPFSVTGQPNAMGGREVGGLANLLAGHMDLDNASHRDIVQRFWKAPNLADKPGLKAVDLFHALSEGKIKALWIMATNPIDSVPVADAAEVALKACPFVVVSDVMANTDTVRHADVSLPALAWGEKDGIVTNSERCVSRMRAFLPAPGEAKPDWWQLSQVACRMGFQDAFDYAHPAEVFREYAAMTGFENAGSRDLDMGVFADISEDEYDNLTPFYWPKPAENPEPETRFFADGGYFTKDRRGRFVAVAPERPRRPDETYPLVLNTGRERDQWHTMTRTGYSPRLAAHMSEPHCEIHPSDADRLGITHGTLVRIESRDGAMTARAELSESQRPGSVFASMHWTDQFASNGRVNALVPAITDPFSGQPASKNVAVRVEIFPAALYGFGIFAEQPDMTGVDYWAIARAAAGWRAEFALLQPVDNPGALARSMTGCKDDAEMLRHGDPESASENVAVFEGERLLGAIFVSERPVDVSRSHAAEALAAPFRDPHSRYALVAGQPAGGKPNPGRIVCACHSIGENEIKAAVAAGAKTADAIGRSLGAGANCGACHAEIRHIIGTG